MPLRDDAGRRRAGSPASFAARAFACAAAALLALSASAATPERHELLGQVVPDLVARDLDGRPVRISEHRGEVVVVSFWSGRCNTCRRQLAALDRISATYASAGLVVVGVNLDEDVVRASEFARAQGVKFAMLVSASKEVGRDFRVDRLPMLVVLDRAGRLRVAHREFKARDEAMYVRELRTLLDE
jgi:peroxiredoxin